MAGTIYTDYINNKNDSSYGIRGEMPYSTPTTTNPTSSSITVSAGYHKKKSFGTTADVSMTIGATGKSNITATATNPSGTDDKTVISSTTWSFTRTTSDYNVTLSVSISLPNSTLYTGTKTNTQNVTIPALPHHTVSYNANGGSGSISAQTKYYGNDITLSDGTGFTRTNYTLKGWNTAADGSGTAYSLGQTYTVNSTTNVTLYAQWELNCITVKSKVNGSWKDGVIHTKVSGNWKLPFIGYAKVNGVWKQII